MSQKRCDILEQIEEQIKLSIDFALLNVIDGVYVDPLSGSEIYAHYGHSHLAYGLLFSGANFNNKEHSRIGKVLIRRILENWDQWSKDRDFHHDFNNFALALCLEYLEKDSYLFRAVESTLLKSSDSSHYTINWLPMRVFVNIRRNKIRPNSRYDRANNSLLGKIDSAINSDGGIEDLLPNDVSYNLQYNASTLGLLQFLNINAEQTKDLSKELMFLISNRLPDHDINYMGRGSNQLFGWGPWIYLLASSQKFDLLEQSIGFIKDQFSFEGELQSVFLKAHRRVSNLHWDYHYPSVYLAHFIMWSCLAVKDYGKSKIDTSAVNVKQYETGIKKVVRDGSGYVTFAGRKKYLAEQGPSICALFFAEIGTIFKGSMGPWPGQFGDKNFSPVNFYHHFGLLELSRNVFFSNRLMRKAISYLPMNFSYRIKPVFALSQIEILDSKTLKISFKLKHRNKRDYVLNVPVFKRLDDSLKLLVHDEKETFEYSSEIMLNNQYEVLKAYQFKIHESTEIDLLISHA